LFSFFLSFVYSLSFLSCHLFRELEAVMKNRVTYQLQILFTTVAVCCIVAVAIGYIVKLNQSVSETIINNTEELATHDQASIQSYIESVWDDLADIQGQFRSYRCETIEDVERIMSVEAANSDFSHLYLVAEDGTAYSDQFVTYDPNSEGQNGRVDLLQYFRKDGRVVSRYEEVNVLESVAKESVLYGIPLEDFSVGGVNMVALVGITDLSAISDRLVITSFPNAEGEPQGRSLVIDMSGNYIVDPHGSIYLDEQENFLTDVRRAKSTDMDMATILTHMALDEPFTFSFTSEDGVTRQVYCQPFPGNEIDWYFLMSVDQSLFAERSQHLVNLSMGMMLLVVLIVSALLLMASRSRRQTVEAKAEASARSGFLANMSHEIRTPLNGIIGLIYLMEKDLDKGEDQKVIRARLEKERETADYLLSLVNNILDISKLEAGKLDLRFDTISPEAIGDNIWSMQKSNMDSRAINFVLEKDIPFPWVMGDDILIKRILMNIVGNAAKFTPAGGSITLSITQEQLPDQRVVTTYRCADTGCGMSEEYQKHIWDSFSQERNAVQNSTKGTGLGMSISKLLVDAMGGEISVQSKLGVGSTFTVALPSQIAEEAPSCLIEARADGSSHADDQEEARPIKLLLAEDNELNAELLVEILEDEGFEVVHAENGQEAVDAFDHSQDREFDAILMDMQMPVLDGCGAAEKIRALDRPDAKNVTIFACTANSFQEDRDRAMESGMNDFITKPIDVKILLKKLGRITAAKQGGKKPET
jgi:signal transduction histidine kinase/ActR/RegA family two-component response regulator/tellurite resistance protein